MCIARVVFKLPCAEKVQTKRSTQNQKYAFVKKKKTETSGVTVCEEFA
jgi:hypothetical protein